jgi:hypothetical protein
MIAETKTGMGRHTYTLSGAEIEKYFFVRNPRLVASSSR